MANPQSESQSPKLINQFDITRPRMMQFFPKTSIDFVGKRKICFIVSMVAVCAGLGVFVRRSYRDQGIGSEMMRELETQTRKAGVEVLYLEVYSISPAIELYKRLGYTEYGRLPGGIKYRGGYVDTVSMYKRIVG